MKKEILAVIPARGGSKGMPGKNTALFHGQPLIGWTITRALASRYITDVVVSTEDPEIQQVAAGYPCKIVFRPTALAQDDTTTTAVLLHTLAQLAQEGYHPEILVLLQCTSPLRTTQHIDESIQLFLESAETDSVISVTPLEHPVQWNRTISATGYLERHNTDAGTQQRQEYAPLYRFNGAIYIMSVSKFLKYQTFETAKTVPYVMAPSHSIDIDTPMDFFVAERLYDTNFI